MCVDQHNVLEQPIGPNEPESTTDFPEPNLNSPLSWDAFKTL